MHAHAQRLTGATRHRRNIHMSDTQNDESFVKHACVKFLRAANNHKVCTSIHGKVHLFVRARHTNLHLD